MIVITLVCVGFGYLVYWSKDWIRQRQEFLKRDNVLTQPPVSVHRAPAGLWIFGEKGEQFIFTLMVDDAPTAKRLFPEATVRLVIMAPAVDPIFDPLLPDELFLPPKAD